MTSFEYEDLLPIGSDETPYRRLTTEGVRTVEEAENHEDNARWNDGYLPREEVRDGSREDS